MCIAEGIARAISHLLLRVPARLPRMRSLPPSALRCPEDRTRRKGVSGAGYMIVGGG